MPLFTEDQLRERARKSRPNISDKELDRDINNLHLPEVDLIASDEECAKMYPKGVYEDMIASILED